MTGYYYGGKQFDISATVAKLRDQLPSLAATVTIDYSTGSPVAGAHDWDALLAEHARAELAYEPVAFDHPLWVLYSSHTTGLPKGIVQGHGGITVEHLKALGLQHDPGPGERFF